MRTTADVTLHEDMHKLYDIFLRLKAHQQTIQPSEANASSTVFWLQSGTNTAWGKNESW